MSSLPTEVISDILCRLPVKNLLCFRCVSKPWCSLIDGQDFVKLHLSYSLKTNTNLSVILRDSHLFSVDFDSLDNADRLNNLIEGGGGTEILGSCNGVLALFNSETDLALLNPSTKKYKKLPILPIQFPPWFCSFHFVIYGFGYDPVSDDYKLVRMVQFYGIGDDSFDTDVKVYSLKADTWRPIRDFSYYLRYRRAYGVLASNSLHWVVSDKVGSVLPGLIVAFDLRVEEYFEVEQPDYVDVKFHMNVGVLGGCLCILCNYFNAGVDIWVMKEYGVKESWSKLFSVAQPEVIRSFDNVIPLAYSKGGDNVLLIQDGKMSVNFVWYDLKMRRAENVRIEGIQRLEGCVGGFQRQMWVEAQMCVGSLVALSGKGGIDGKQQQDREGKKKKKGKKSKLFPEYAEKYDQQQLSEQLVSEQLTPESPREEISRPNVDKLGSSLAVDTMKDTRRNRKHSFPTWMMLLLVPILGIIMALPLLQLRCQDHKM